jgi:hypothetical protein
VAFDLLAVGEVDLRPAGFGERRKQLEGAVQPKTHLVVTPQTQDPEIARGWLTDLAARGFEGDRGAAVCMIGEPATGVAKIVVGLPVVAGGHALDAGVGPQGVDTEEDALLKREAVEVLPGERTAKQRGEGTRRSVSFICPRACGHWKTPTSSGRWPSTATITRGCRPTSNALSAWWRNCGQAHGVARAR